MYWLENHKPEKYIEEVVRKGYFTAKIAKVSQRYAKIKCSDLILCDSLRN